MLTILLCFISNLKKNYDVNRCKAITIIGSSKIDMSPEKIKFYQKLNQVIQLH